MKLSHLAHDPVFHIVRNAIDIEQVYTLAGHRNPFLVTNAVMAAGEFAWIAWDDAEPVAVFGASQIHDGVWNAFLLTTPAFPKIVLPITRFAKHTVVPALFSSKVGAHRIQAELHQDNTYVHRWVQALGAKRESVKQGYSRDGADYVMFALLKKSTKSTT